MNPTPKTSKPSKVFTEYYGSIFFVMVALFLATAGIVLKPMLDTVKQANADIAQGLARVDREQAYLDSLQQSIAAAQHITPAVLERVDRAVPRQTNIPELLVMFSDAAKRDNVQIGNITFTEPATAKAPAKKGATTSTIRELPITLTVNAPGYQMVKRFLRDVERSLRLIDITGLSVTAREGGTSYVIQAKAYVFPELPHD